MDGFARAFPDRLKVEALALEFPGDRRAKNPSGHESVVTTQRYARANEKAVRRDAERVYAVQEANYR
jgi:hypothetical protein